MPKPAVKTPAKPAKPASKAAAKPVKNAKQKQKKAEPVEQPVEQGYNPLIKGARTFNYLKDSANGAGADLVEDMRETLKANKDTLSDAEKATLKDKIDAVGKVVHNVGGFSRVLLSTVADELVVELMRFALQNLKDSNVKTRQVNLTHILNFDYQSLSLYSLFKDLPVFTEAVHEHTVSDLLAQLEKAEAKADKKKNKQAEVQCEAAAEEEQVDEADEDKKRPDFKTYINTAFKVVQKEFCEDETNYSKASHLVSFLNELLCQLFQKLANYSQVFLTKKGKKKTITPEFLLKSINAIMMGSEVPNDSVTLTLMSNMNLSRREPYNKEREEKLFADKKARLKRQLDAIPDNKANKDKRDAIVKKMNSLKMPEAGSMYVANRELSMDNGFGRICEKFEENKELHLSALKVKEDKD